MAKIKHGHRMSGNNMSLTYNSWRNMKARCNNPNHEKYPIYGARGIKVCTQWNKFEGFLKDMCERPEGKTIDRINPDGNYEPSNCRWANNKMQQNNKRKKK